MALAGRKILPSDISRHGVIAAPDKLTGTANENKKVFDRLIQTVVAVYVNALIDDLMAATGAAEIGAAVPDMTEGTVQAVLSALKLMVDARAKSADVEAALILKSEKSVTNTHFKDVSLDETTGKISFIREDGSFKEIDTALEKVATNWRYDSEAQALVLSLADGSTQTVSLSDFITLTEFLDSDNISFSVSGNKVTANIRPGSITDELLSSALAEQLVGYVSAAAESATKAKTSETNAKTSEEKAAQSAIDAANAAKNAAAEVDNELAAKVIATENAQNDARTAASDAQKSASDAETAKTEAETASAAAAKSASDAENAAGNAAAAVETSLADKVTAAESAKKGAEDAENAAKAAQEAAEKARDEAGQIVGGDFATNQQAQGYAGAAVSSHNTATDAHNDIRLLLEGLTTRLNTALNSDDVTLDQMAEVAAYIKANRNLIEQITTGKVSVTDIVNNLTTNVSNKPLSAAQGVALKALIDAIKVPTSASDLGLTTETLNITYEDGTTRVLEVYVK